MFPLARSSRTSVRGFGDTRRRGVYRVVFAVLAVCVVLVVAAPVSAEREQDPFSLGDAFPPRVVRVDGVTGVDGPVRLVDADGRDVPLTGDLSSLSGDVLSVYPPRLPAGTYSVEYPGGSHAFTVGSPLPEVASPARSGGLLWLLPLVALVPAALLLARPRRTGARLAGLAVAALGLAAAGGLFVLVGSSGRALPQGDPCLNRQDLTACATGYVVGVLDDFGPQIATGELVRLSGASGSAWARICHEPAHELGIRTWKTTGSLEEAVAAGTTSCSLGYVHGLLQAMGTYLDDEEFPPAARALCDGLDERYRDGDLVDGAGAGNGPSTLLGCHHGVGHAAMWRFNEDLRRAAPVCSGFSLAEQQEECRVGAVMEWVYASQRAARSNSPQDRPSPQVGRPVELCLPPLGVLSPGCVEGAVTAVGPDDVAATAGWCKEHPEVLAACVQSLARRMVQMDLSRVAPLLDAVPGFCSSFGESYPAEDCAERFGYMLLFLSRDRARTDEFCASLSEPLATGCVRGVDKVLEYAAQIGDDSFNVARTSGQSS
ncbi:MAG: hypothetical protein KJS90_09225 [Acidobacteria bacterium]|nr:hypothetical protein [Acidobacteriota bacterium]